jgi:DNA-binding beta-propeller fold protein YncE
MNDEGPTRKLAIVALAAFGLALVGQTFAADSIKGQVLGSGAPIANSTVTLWAATSGPPAQLGQARTDADGRFSLNATTERANDASLYLVAKGGKSAADKTSGDNFAIALMAVVGSKPPAAVTINELTTVASVWTGAQFLKGDSLSGHALGLRIAAGNVPNLVDLATGGLGPVIQDPLNSTQTTDLSIFSTLGDLLAGCITRVRSDACTKLFATSTPPGGAAPTDTLTAAEAIALHPWNKPATLFALLNDFYPAPHGPGSRAAPFRPYLLFAPSTWTIALRYAGGGLAGLGGIAIDSEGNAWAADNQMAGSQSTMFGGIGGTLSELAPDGRPLSPMTTGYTGGGVDFPGWGLTIAGDGKVWVTSIEGKTISVFDHTGRPLSPPTGYNFNGQLGSMQGITVTPNGDVWAVDALKNQIAYFPKGDPAQARLLCRTVNGKPADGTCQVKGPFHVAIDQQGRILVSNANSDTVTRFPANDPSHAEQLKVGYSPHAIAIDSQGNAWVANTMGDPSKREMLALLWNKVKKKLDPGAKGNQAIEDFIALVHVLQAYPGGSVSMIRPDGTQGPGSPFNGGDSIIGPWGITIDGNDHVWIANGFGKTVTELCGARTETCPPGYKTGDPISPPKTGYAGKGMQFLTGVVIDPAGNAWVANNIDLLDEVCIKQIPDESLSTRCGGNAFVEFFGVAKPVKTPVVGGQVRGW